MKKRFSFLFTLLFFSIFVNAQSFTLTDENGIDITGTTVTLKALAGEELIDYHVFATNNSTENKTARVKKIYVNIVENSENSFCYAGNCFGEGTMISGTYFEILPGATIPSGDELHSTYNSNGNEGITTITYAYFDVYNTNDSAYVTINYVYPHDFIGIENISDKNCNISNAYPNPTNKQAKIDVCIDNLEDAKIIFFNVLGEKIKDYKINKTNETLEINTSNWQPGIYYYSLINGFKNLATKKLIINR